MHWHSSNSFCWKVSCIRHLLGRLFTSFNMSCHCFLASIVSDEKPFIHLIVSSLNIMNQFFLTDFKTFSLSSFSILTTICLYVDLLKFILLGLYWSPCICRLIFSINLGRFQPIFLCTFLFISLCLLLLVFPLCIYWYTEWSPIFIWSPVQLFFTLFPLCSGCLIFLIYLQVHCFFFSFFCPLRSIVEPCYWHFSFWLLFFSNLEIHFDSFL